MFLAVSLGSPFKAYSVNMGNGDISSYLNLINLYLLFLFMNFFFIFILKIRNHFYCSIAILINFLMLFILYLMFNLFLKFIDNKVHFIITKN